MSPQTDAPAWRWSNIPIPQAHLVGLGTGILLQGVRPWPLPWPAWIGHGGGWPLLLTGLWLGAWAEQLVPDEVWAAVQPCSLPVTCWRRLRDWQHVGVWTAGDLAEDR